MSQRAERLKTMDWIMFSLYIALVGLGWLIIYAVTKGEQTLAGTFGFWDTSSGKQTIWVGISSVAFIIISLLDWKTWQTFSYFIYGVAILLLILVLFLGTEIKGATAWFRFGSFAFQPSELAKFATCLALASFMNTYTTDLKKTSSLLIAFALLLLPITLVLLQPDAGSALVFLSFFILLYREGLSPSYFVVGGITGFIFLISLVADNPNLVILGLIGIASLALFLQFEAKFYGIAFAIATLSLSFYFFNKVEENTRQFILVSNAILFVVLALFHGINKKGRLVGVISMLLLLSIGLSYFSNYAFNNFLRPHQQERIYMWLRPEKCDPSGPLYNVIQSKKAISSGGFQGKGLFEGTITKLNYVPEQSTDFIFCVIAEEQGFIGSAVLMGLFLALILRIVIVAERQRSNFSRYYAYSVAGILFVHVFINIGMTMGVMPIIGIPLPFLSKGGSSLLGFSVMIAVLIKLDSHRYSI